MLYILQIQKISLSHSIQVLLELILFLPFFFFENVYFGFTVHYVLPAVMYLIIKKRLLGYID